MDEILLKRVLGVVFIILSILTFIFIDQVIYWKEKYILGKKDNTAPHWAKRSFMRKSLSAFLALIGGLLIGSTFQ